MNGLFLKKSNPMSIKVFRNISPEFVDERGGITRLLDEQGAAIRSVLYITSKAGTIRSNHYHKRDTHYCYLLTGKAEWHEKPVEGGAHETEVLGAGDMVYTPAMVIHAVKFLEDTTFLAFATEPRNQADYEADTVRVQLI